jgi:hypothetical protein
MLQTKGLAQTLLYPLFDIAREETKSFTKASREVGRQ